MLCALSTMVRWNQRRCLRKGLARLVLGVVVVKLTTGKLETRDVNATNYVAFAIPREC